MSPKEQYNYNKALAKIEACRNSGEKSLDLSGMGLTKIPPEIGGLHRLMALYLRDNKLTSLPPEIGQLTALTWLDLDHNKLTSLPPEIGQLTALTLLYLSHNQLTSLPPEIGQLAVLKELYLTTNKLTSLPPEIGQLTVLAVLALANNQLTELLPEIGQLTALKKVHLSTNQLTILTAEIGQLTALKELDLSHNQLTSLPTEIGQLTALTDLYLISNQLTSLPDEIGQLTSLNGLYVSENRLAALPKSIGKLQNLRDLRLGYNLVTELPTEIGNLSKLETLRLGTNKVVSLPAEVGKLKRLIQLSISDNQLTSLPAEITQLSALTELSIFNNPLLYPPETVCEQGIEAIRQYFQDKASTGEETIWRSKLLLVGEGRVGKTELRHRLLGRPHGGAKSTEVMEIETIPLLHPTIAGVTMNLNCWDFGGQEIYHATHQFFLTGRSLFVFCLEAGKDWEVGKPYYWLDKISAVAPDAPVVIVATKGDERSASGVPWKDLKKRYPQIVGEECFLITTKSANRKDYVGDGIKELIDCLQKVAADKMLLPLMGESLPNAWVNGMRAVAQHPNDYYLRRAEFCGQLESAGVPVASLHTVASMMRDLGEILYYCEEVDAVLHDWVIIKPSWVTQAAAKILDSATVADSAGILTMAEMRRVWQGIYPDAMHPVLLDLMEKYDLTYKIPEDASDRSLVVEQLPKDESPSPQIWDALRPDKGSGNHEMEMTFHLASMQAGIPTWFIAKKHYYTMRKHWRYGVYFADDRKAPRHVALVRASTNPSEPVVRLAVRGPFPQTFFAVMKEGLEQSIKDRYPKLITELTIPCCCHDDNDQPGAAACTHAFNYQRLLERQAKSKATAECDISQTDVQVSRLLFGYDAPVSATMKRIEDAERLIVEKVDGVGDKVDDVKEKMDELGELVRQSFRYLYHDLQQKEETHCPNLFVIWKAAKGKPFHVPMRLALCCQHPGHEHIACRPDKKGEPYEIDALQDHLRKAAPLLKGVRKVLKYAKLTGLSAVKEWDKALGDFLGESQETMDALLEDFGSISEKGEAPDLLLEDIDHGDRQLKEKRVAGAALREFRALLDKVDPDKTWHGLVKKRSNLSGEYLWVCEKHAEDKSYLR